MLVNHTNSYPKSRKQKQKLVSLALFAMRITPHKHTEPTAYSTHLTLHAAGTPGEQGLGDIHREPGPTLPGNLERIR